jgi:NADPH:quinone reductase-like Zn-dependent oxidoreductase
MIAIRVAGHISVIGILSGTSGAMNFVPVLIKQVRLQGVLVGSRSQQQDMIRAINANGMRPIIDRHFPLSEIVEAFKYQETNQHFGKICLDI